MKSYTQHLVDVILNNEPQKIRIREALRPGWYIAEVNLGGYIFKHGGQSRKEAEELLRCSLNRTKTNALNDRQATVYMAL